MPQFISADLITATARKAADSPRRRMNHNFHAGPTDNPHRFLNVLLHGTYVRPHRHADPPKAETFLVMEGQAAVIIFDEHGRILEHHTLSSAGPIYGIDLEPGIWHTILALTPRTVCFEVKPGPWEPATDKDFAPWAPKETDPAAPGYLARLGEALS